MEMVKATSVKQANSSDIFLASLSTDCKRVDEAFEMLYEIQT